MEIVQSRRNKFVNHVRNTKPSRPEDTGYDLRLLSKDDESAFRDVFDVLVDDKSVGLVIKFPQRCARKRNIEHSLFEAQAVDRIRHDPQLKALRRYLPTILWHEPSTGVIVMPKYRPVKYGEYFEGFQQTFRRMVEDLLPDMKYQFDYGDRNFGLNSRGHYILLDAGMLGELKK
jgi:hypothetical protein